MNSIGDAFAEPGFENEITGRIKVATGEVSKEDYEKSIKATAIVERSEDEKSAGRIHIYILIGLTVLVSGFVIYSYTK